jgi:hypothetical protein
MPERESHGRSEVGVELTDEVLDRMADEAEEGLDIAKLRRRSGRLVTRTLRGNPSSRQRVRAGRRHEPLGHPVVDVMEPVVERASIELDGCPQ